MVHPAVILDWDDGIPLDESQVEGEVRQAFELGLLRAGVKVVDDYSGPVLFCSMNIMWVEDDDYRGGGFLVYSTEVKLSVLVYPALYPPGGQLTAAVTWDTGKVGLASPRNLGPEDEGQYCAETFEREWRLANQGN